MAPIWSAILGWAWFILKLVVLVPLSLWFAYALLVPLLVCLIVMTIGALSLGTAHMRRQVAFHWSNMRRRLAQLRKRLRAHTLRRVRESDWVAWWWLRLLPQHRFDCDICGDTGLPAYRTASMHTDAESGMHRMCHSCLRNTVLHASGHVQIACPMCHSLEKRHRQYLRDDTLTDVFCGYPDQLQRVRRWQLEQGLNSLSQQCPEGTRLWRCATPNCNNAKVLEVPRNSLLMSHCLRLECEGCGACTCKRCERPWSARLVKRSADNRTSVVQELLHTDESDCEQYARRIRRLESAMRVKNQKLRDTGDTFELQTSNGSHAYVSPLSPESVNSKLCPQCGALISRTAGCNHMTCKCKHEFCYVCLMPHRGHNSASCTERWQLDRTARIAMFQSSFLGTVSEDVVEQLQALNLERLRMERVNITQTVRRAPRRRRCFNAVRDRTDAALHRLVAKLRIQHTEGLRVIKAFGRMLFSVLRVRLMIALLGYSYFALRRVGLSLPMRVLRHGFGSLCGIFLFCVFMVCQFFARCRFKQRMWRSRRRRRQRPAPRLLPHVPVHRPRKLQQKQRYIKRRVERVVRQRTRHVNN